MESVVYSFFSRLQVAMWSRGLGVSEVKTLCGVSDGRFQRWKQDGTIWLSDSELKGIYRVTGFCPEFFQRGDISGLPECGFVDDSVPCASAVLGLELNGDLRRLFNYPHPEKIVLHSENVKQAARELRALWGFVDEKPLPNVVQLLESKGFGVFGMLPGGSVAVNRAGGFPCMFVPLFDSAARFRLEVVKQLGEIVLFPSGVNANQDVGKTASQFALEFCVPDNFVMKHMRASMPFDEIASFSTGLKVPFNLLAWKLFDMEYLTHDEYVSLMRLEKVRNPDSGVGYDRSRLFDVVVSDTGGLDVLARKIKFPVDVLGGLMLGVRPYAVFGSGAVELGARQNESRHLHVVK